MEAGSAETRKGEMVAVFPTDYVAVVFEKVTKEGSTAARKITIPPEDARALKNAVQYYEVGTEKVEYEGRIEIRIILDREKAEAVDPKRIKLWQLNEGWNEIDMRFNAEYNLIIAETTHLSIFGVTR